MKARIITVIEYLYIGVLLIAMGILNFMALVCFSMAAFVKYTVKAVIAIKELIREVVRAFREVRSCYKIPIMEYLEYIRMECKEAWNFRNEIIEACKA